MDWFLLPALLAWTFAAYWAGRLHSTRLANKAWASAADSPDTCVHLLDGRCFIVTRDHETEELLCTH